MSAGRDPEIVFQNASKKAQILLDWGIRFDIIDHKSSTGLLLIAIPGIDGVVHALLNAGTSLIDHGGSMTLIIAD